MTTLQAHGNGIFERNDPASLLTMEFGHRTTVVQLSDAAGGGVWIHSPAAFSAEFWEELNALAPHSADRHLIIPSRTHDIYLKEWMERIAPETTYSPAAIQRVHPRWKIGQTLADDFSAPWSKELPHIRLHGAPRVNEVVFYHKPSKTLILVDCVFNLTAARPFLARLLFPLNGCKMGICTSRLFRFFIKDKAALGASIARVLEWDFERVFVGHGEVIEGDEVAQLRAHLASL